MFSIRAFFDGLMDHGVQLVSDPQILRVFLALYDSLVDDDEDIRDQGAKIVSTILSQPPTGLPKNKPPTLSLSPPAAKQRLLRYLQEGYRDSMHLCVEGVRRLTDMTLASDSEAANMQDESQIKQRHSNLPIRIFPELLLDAGTTSTVVFVEERQNLYIDTVSEAEGWAELLVQLDPAAWSSSLVSDLECWTMEGLAHIHEILQNGVDEALAPTSKAEVFALVTRVLLVAKVLIMRCGIDVSSSDGKGKEHVCVGMLAKLLETGRSRLFHDLLLHRIETIIEKN